MAEKVELHVEDSGGAGRPVILVHGWPLSGAAWEKQVPVLRDAGFRVLTYDRRGFGRSSKPATGYDYDTLTADLHQVILDRDLRDVTIVGFSMGGGEIARYLSRRGASRVGKVVLIASVAGYLLKDDTNPDGVDASVFEDMKSQIRKDRFAFLQSFAKQFYGVGLVSRPVSQGILDWSFVLGVMASPKATIDCVDAFSRTDFRPDFASFTVPTLVIHGTGDDTVPIDLTGRAAAGAISGARLIEYDGEPHGLFATVPDRLNADLIEFLR